MPERSIQAAHFSEDVQEFLRLLHEHRVRYLIVGGEAVILHGHPRYTGDVDFHYQPTPENARRLFEALREFWGGSVPAVATSEELLQDGIVVQYGRPPNRIDLLSRVDGVEFDTAWERRVDVLLTGNLSFTIPFLSVTDLIASKRAAGRHKDLEDLRYLLQTPPD